MVRKLFALLFTTCLLAGFSFAQEEAKTNDKSKARLFAAAEAWGSNLTEFQLLQLPDLNRDVAKFRTALPVLASYTDGEREHVNDFLKAANYPVDDQNERWNALSPSTKIALAAKQAYSKSDRDGNLFGALLAQRLAQSYPAAKTEDDLKPFFVETAAEAKPEFDLTTAKKDLQPLPEDLARAIDTLATYVSSTGAITDADLLRMTPMSASERIEILANAESSVELLRMGIARTQEILSTDYAPYEVNLLAKKTMSEWVKAVHETYPAAALELDLKPWLEFGGGGPTDPPPASANGPYKPKPSPSGGRPRPLRDLFESKQFEAKGGRTLLP